MATAQPQLSREEMYADFDTLVKIIREADPQLEVIRQVTGKDILAEIMALRPSIDTITRFPSYYKLVAKALHITQDEHHHIIYCEREDNDCAEPSNYYVNDTIKELSVLMTEELWKNRKLWSFRELTLMGLLYINGNYYFAQDLMDAKNKEIIIFPKGTRVLKINGTDIDTYVVTVAENIGSHLRWDALRKKYYAKFDMSINRKENVTINAVLPTGEIKDIYLYSDKPMHYAGTKSTDTEDPKVIYFANDNILYIHIIEMDMEQLPFYTEEITKMKHRKIEKVIIDIRGNTGGSDRVWHEVLASIVDKPVTARQTLLFKHTPTVITYLNKIRGKSMSYTGTNNTLVGKDTLICLVDEIDTIAPAANSIAYAGNIYVLADERSFSSAGAFISICNKVERLISVGKATGNISGRGINPFIFSLPHSKLMFRLLAAIEGIYSDNIEDYYHDNREIYVEPSVEEVLLEFNWEKERYGEEYLFTYDSTFKKVLEL
jgi:hypothetical protein